MDNQSRSLGMSRRGHRRQGRSGSPGGPSTLAFEPKFWIDSDHYTLNATNVEAWVDLVAPGHTFALGGTRVAEPAVSGAIMGGRKFATYAAGNWYQSNTAASAWDFMSNGAGMSAFYVVRRTSVANCLFHATQAGAARTTGYDWNYDGVSSNLCLGSNPSVNTALLAPNIDRCVAHTYDGTTGRTYSNGVQLVSGAQAPFAGAVEAMSIGADVNGAFSSTMYWCASIWFDRTLSATDVAVVSALLRRMYQTS
jgi:hypothetical protein